jgi:NADH:ubiquinone oxidoreductase subunit 2 (subunit N)
MFLRGMAYSSCRHELYLCMQVWANTAQEVRMIMRASSFPLFIYIFNRFKQAVEQACLMPQTWIGCREAEADGGAD